MDKLKEFWKNITQEHLYPIYKLSLIISGIVFAVGFGMYMSALIIEKGINKNNPTLRQQEDLEKQRKQQKNGIIIMSVFGSLSFISIVLCVSSEKL